MKTFTYEERKGKGEVVMLCYLPACHVMPIWVPPGLEAQLKDATGGINWTSALAPLADYALDLLSLEKPSHLTITPQPDPWAEPVCQYSRERGRRSITVAGTMPGYQEHLRKRTKIPADVLARIRTRVPSVSVSAAVPALVQFAVLDLRERKKFLLIRRK